MILLLRVQSRRRIVRRHPHMAVLEMGHGLRFACGGSKYLTITAQAGGRHRRLSHSPATSLATSPATSRLRSS